MTNELDSCTDPGQIEDHLQKKKETKTEKNDNAAALEPPFYRNSYSCYQVSNLSHF